MARHFCAIVLEHLLSTADAPDGVDPVRLREMAAQQADDLRRRLTLGGDPPAVGDLQDWTAGLEELRCHLHDTTLQVLEYVAAGGYGMCTTVAEIRDVEARAAADLAAWLFDDSLTVGHVSVRDAVRSVVAEHCRLGDSPARVSVGRGLPDVDREIAQALQGAVRESLTNIRKHAHAKNVRVTVAWVAEEIVVTVADDGVGVVPGAAMGRGISHSICGRLARVGGAAEVRTSPRGTEVRLRTGAAR